MPAIDRDGIVDGLDREDAPVEADDWHGIDIMDLGNELVCVNWVLSHMVYIYLYGIGLYAQMRGQRRALQVESSWSDWSPREVVQ